MTEQGYITAARDEVVDGRLRRCYELTDVGAGRLAEQADRMTKQAATAQRRLKAKFA